MGTEDLQGFGVLILTHGRAEKVVTYRTLRRQGYTGPIWLVVDDEDQALSEYQRRYRDEVVVFSKAVVAPSLDAGDNFPEHRGVVYARNASFGIARALGLDWFLVLDDDYLEFRWKFDASLVYRDRPVKSLDRLFGSLLTYYRSIPAVTVALGQTGDFIGGKRGGAGTKLWLKRKAMNTFFCSPDRPIAFPGRSNEDVTAYVTLGNRGLLFLTVFNAVVRQVRTQASRGGMTELYLDQGTYLKSWYSVMYAPSCVRVADMGERYRRIHHRVHWSEAVPCIVGEDLRKGPKPSRPEPEQADAPLLVGVGQ